MPSTAGPRLYENHIPSFMTVYDMDSTLVDSSGLVPASKLSGTTHLSPEQTQQQQLQSESENEQSRTQNSHMHLHQHRESTSTQTSDSTDSSPTTTISTVDSASLSDPSPSSSPESPITLIPLSSFSGSSFGLDSFQTLKMADTAASRPLMNDTRPMTSPSPRKAKNPKSLALNLSGIATPSTESFQASEPASPSFIKPPTLTGKRKPSLLSLNTGAANGLSLNLAPLNSPGMPSMLQRRGLKHSISSPQMLSTPSFGPSGGMTLGDRKAPLGQSRKSNLATDAIINEDSEEPPTQMATRIPGVEVGGDTFDRPHSGEDAKSPSYPDGPILMHEPSVHLYLEPKLEEAMDFDVVINVAREVKNPFKAAEERRQSEPAPHSVSPDPLNITADLSDIPPDTAATMMSFQTAFEVMPTGSTVSSPTTPKAADKKEPEYIHVPWDHNTDVKDELWDLCQTIEDRTKEGKRVLVHCQQGASRSATLIIAYHMYMNQDLGPNEAYSLAQGKSRWVNPNMSLLFSLNDFKKVIDRKKAEKASAARKPIVKHRPTLSADGLDQPPTPSRARGNSTPSTLARDLALAKVEEKPSEAPVVTSNNPIPRLGGFDFGFGNIGFGEMAISNKRERPKSDDWEGLMSPRQTEMTSNPIHDQTFSRSYNIEPEPATPNLFSPRAFEFPRSPFFPQQAPLTEATLPTAEDPRSPPTKGEAPIIRSIDDFL